MEFILLLVAAGALYAFSQWYQDKKEADTVARLEKLRGSPGAAAAVVDGLIAQRKRETETMRDLSKRGPY